MYEVKFTTAYKKSYRLMKKRGLNLSLLDEVVDALRQGRQLEEKYHDHGLSGRFQGFRECHIKPDWLLVYLLEDDILTLTLIDTGSHADILICREKAVLSNESCLLRILYSESVVNYRKMRIIHYGKTVSGVFGSII